MITASGLTFTTPVFFHIKNSLGYWSLSKMKTAFVAHCYFGLECIICETESLSFGGDGTVKVNLGKWMLYYHASSKYYEDV